MPKTFQGKMRAKITMIDGGVIVEWIDVDTNETVWTETVKPLEGCSAVTQVMFSGEAQIVPGYFIDEQGGRHLVLQAETAHFVRPR